MRPCASSEAPLASPSRPGEALVLRFGVEQRGLKRREIVLGGFLLRPLKRQ